MSHLRQASSPSRRGRSPVRSSEASMRSFGGPVRWTGQVAGRRPRPRRLYPPWPRLHPAWRRCVRILRRSGSRGRVRAGMNRTSNGRTVPLPRRACRGDWRCGSLCSRSRGPAGGWCSTTSGWAEGLRPPVWRGRGRRSGGVHGTPGSISPFLHAGRASCAQSVGSRQGTTGARSRWCPGRRATPPESGSPGRTIPRRPSVNSSARRGRRPGSRPASCIRFSTSAPRYC